MRPGKLAACAGVAGLLLFTRRGPSDRYARRAIRRPWLVMAPGAAAAAPGALQHDHLLLTGPGFATAPWHSQVHNVVRSIAYAATAPLRRL